jgi:hypothetical protein
VAELVGADTNSERAICCAIYRPPHQGIEMSIFEREASENFEYFMSQRSTRIAQLRNLLAPFWRHAGFLWAEQTRKWTLLLCDAPPKLERCSRGRNTVARAMLMRS